MQKWEKFSEQELRNIVENSKTYKEILNQLGYKDCSNNNKYVRQFCDIYNIDYSHLNQGKKDNLIDQIFGSMKVISEDYNKNKTKSKNAYWFCECQACNNHTIKSVCGADLKRGKVTNCGCQKTERIIKQNHNNFIDLSNKDFGYLHIIEPIFDGDNFTNKYKCRCICQKIIEVYRSNLVNGGTISCGCQTVSLGERNTEDCLKKMNIDYTKQYKFPDLIGTLYPLKFDFAIFKNDKIFALIECQGQQHYYPIDIFGGEERFKQQQLYDKKKEEYCKDRSIPLLKIPYFDYNKINIDYITNLLNRQSSKIL